MTSGQIIQPGRNCWRVEAANRVAFLIDGEAYFGAVRDALEQARESVYILGWDIDSRIRLDHNGGRDGYPERLGEFLNALVQRRRGLHIHILVWDFAMIYALEREWLPIYKLGWQSHRRLHFRMDGRHPAGASQHQKVVVIDDQAAFVGGMDLSKWRWDTTAHHPADPRRSGPEGHHYPPYHDVQILVTGPAARALGELARERWRRATGERLRPPQAPPEPWPAGLRPDLERVEVAIARTFPRYNGWGEVREVERLYADAIGAARRHIFIENQYFTSHRIAELLAARLSERSGPEIVVILPKRSSGWLEQHTMDVLRARLLKRLFAADRHRRLGIFYPEHPEVLPEFINIHDKVMVVDDEFLRIGSANLSNRSMGFDSECDLAIEARGDPLLSASIAAFRSRLLAEHLETRPEIVDQVMRREGSLLRSVAALRRPGKSLIELEPRIRPGLDEWVPDAAFIDPERPIASEAVVDHLMSEAERPPARRYLLRSLTLVAAVLALAIAWRLTPLRDYMEVERLFDLLAALRGLPAAPALVVLGFVAAGLLAFPLTVLVVVTVLAFGPLPGFTLALTGAMASAFVTYGIGHRLGRDLVRRLAGHYVNRLSERLARRGVLAVMVIRILPIAPYSLVNVVAGASHIRFRDYAIGTFFGLLPGLLAITLFVDRVAATLQRPDPANTLTLLAVGLLLLLVTWLLRRLLLKRREAAARAMARSGPRE